jgi:predicted transglutaminase-like cysteine proteinase
MKQLGLLLTTLLIATLTPLWAQETPVEKDSKGPTVQSQPQPTPTRGDVLTPANLATRLNLTEEQRARIEGLWKQYNDRSEQVRRDTSLTSEQRIVRLRQAREEYVRLIRSVLNEEQLKKFEALLEEQSPALGSLANMRLTPEQMEKIREIVQRYNKIRQQITQDTSLTPDQRSRRLQEVNQQMMQEIRNALPKNLQEQWDKATKRDQQQQGGKKDEKKENPPQNP